MLPPRAHVCDLQLFKEFFGGARDTSSLGELRMPAGSFQISDAEKLIDQGLARYLTETGIAFQIPEEWDLIPTEKGRELLQEGD